MRQPSEPQTLSIVIPARNEAAPLGLLLPVLRSSYPDAQIIVVNDGSTDETSEVCTQHGVTELRHPYGIGNGAAIKSGVRAASGELLVLMDADGQHDPADISRLLERLSAGYDMAVGARDSQSQANVGRSLANRLYNRLASWMTNQEIRDLTSGFRAAKAQKFREFLHLLPNGFSYPTTISMAFFRAGYTVTYVPIRAAKRVGKSHVQPLRDGLRFLLIIFKIGTLYSPLKLFFPISSSFFLIGLAHYLYTYVTAQRFTNMSALMLTTAVVIFLIGLVSEQITQLIYQPVASRDAREGATAGAADPQFRPSKPDWAAEAQTIPTARRGSR